MTQDRNNADLRECYLKYRTCVVSEVHDNLHSEGDSQDIRFQGEEKTPEPALERSNWHYYNRAA